MTLPNCNSLPFSTQMSAATFQTKSEAETFIQTLDGFGSDFGLGWNGSYLAEEQIDDYDYGALIADTLVAMV